MVLLIVSNLMTELAWWVGYILAFISAIAIIFMLGLRRIAFSTQQRSELVRDKWEDILYQAVEPSAIKPVHFLPESTEENAAEEIQLANFEEATKQINEVFAQMAKSDFKEFLVSWNYLHESLRGEAKEKLNSFANSLSIKEKALKDLKSRSLEKKLLAIETLGNIGEKDVWDNLIVFANHSDPSISLWAVRALFRIDTEKSLTDLLPLIATRIDWSPVFVGKMLSELTSDVLSEPLSNLVADCYLKKFGDKQMGRVISYLTMAHPADYNHIICYIIQHTTEQETLIGCLRLVNSKQVSSRVRECLKDNRWQVRMHAVQTLGRLGYQKDIKKLVQGLNDLEWWVRYRSACALAFDPSITHEKIEQLSQTLPNEFARDILTQVLAEIRLKCLQKPPSANLSK